MRAMIERWLSRIPLWRHGNLVDADMWAEIHILVPRNGERPKMFVPKTDAPSTQYVQTVVNAVIGAALDFARLYNVNVAGFLGQPICPHCNTQIVGPPVEPPK